MVGVRELLFQPVIGDYPVNGGVPPESVYIALYRGDTRPEGFQQLGHRPPQRSKPDDQHPLAEEPHTPAVVEPPPGPALPVFKRRSELPVEVQHHRQEAFAHDAAVEAAITGLHPAGRVCGNPVMTGGGREKSLQFRGALVPVRLEDPGQNAISLRKLFKKIAGPFGDGNMRIREARADLIEMSRFEIEGIDTVVKMDEKVVYFHGCTLSVLRENFTLTSHLSHCSFWKAGCSAAVSIPLATSRIIPIRT